MDAYLILLVGFGLPSLGLLLGIFFADEGETSWSAVLLLSGAYMLNGAWVGGLALVLLLYIVPATVAAISALIVAFFAGRHLSR